jgi:hypothetical protein
LRHSRKEITEIAAVPLVVGPVDGVSEQSDHEAVQQDPFQAVFAGHQKRQEERGRNSGTCSSIPLPDRREDMAAQEGHLYISMEKYFVYESYDS